MKVFNQNPDSLLIILVGHQKAKWVLDLAQIEFSYSISLNGSIGRNPL
jgi:hypothetical protein